MNFRPEIIPNENDQELICYECKKPLGQYFLSDRDRSGNTCQKLSLKNISSNKLYHPKCSVKCTACNALIGAEEYVKLGEFSFHWNCYKCKVC